MLRKWFKKPENGTPLFTYLFSFRVLSHYENRRAVLRQLKARQHSNAYTTCDFLNETLDDKLYMHAKASSRDSSTKKYNCKGGFAFGSLVIEVKQPPFNLSISYRRAPFLQMPNELAELYADFICGTWKGKGTEFMEKQYIAARAKMRKGLSNHYTNNTRKHMIACILTWYADESVDQIVRDTCGLVLVDSVKADF